MPQPSDNSEIQQMRTKIALATEAENSLKHRVKILRADHFNIIEMFDRLKIEIDRKYSVEKAAQLIFLGKEKHYLSVKIQDYEEALMANRLAIEHYWAVLASLMEEDCLVFL